MKIDGATRGIRCAAKTLGQWCTRDAGHPGAHEARDPQGRGSIGWWNDEYLRPRGHIVNDLELMDEKR